MTRTKRSDEFRVNRMRRRKERGGRERTKDVEQRTKNENLKPTSSNNAADSDSSSSSNAVLSSHAFLCFFFSSSNFAANSLISFSSSFSFSLSPCWRGSVGIDGDVRCAAACPILGVPGLEPLDPDDELNRNLKNLLSCCCPGTKGDGIWFVIVGESAVGDSGE